jgi:hypothetical protein
MRRERCSCGALCEAWYGEVVSGMGDWYTFDSSLHCPTCGQRQEGRGCGRLPEDVRDAMLAAHGVWAVWVPAPLRVRALAAIRVELGMSFAEVAATRGEAGPLTTGTFAEVERLRLRLAERGFEAEVRR